MKSERLNIELNRKTILIFLIFNFGIWIVSAIFDFAFGPMLCNLLCIPQMYHTEMVSFFDVLILNIPPMLLLHRILIMIIFYFLSLSIYFFVILKKLKISEQNLFNSNASKNKLFGIIAHDLRSPFNGILGLSKILVEEHRDMTQDEIHDFSTAFYQSSQNLYNFLEDLLIWAKSQMNQINIEKCEVDLNETFKIISRLFEQNLKSKNISFKTEITDKQIIVTDKNIFDTVLRNIGGEIKITHSKDNNNKNVISVIDNGVGISEDDIMKIFKMDSKFTTPGTNNEKGTGLGLLLCKELTEKIGGEIRISSKIGSGTIVSLTI